MSPPINIYISLIFFFELTRVFSLVNENDRNIEDEVRACYGIFWKRIFLEFCGIYSNDMYEHVYSMYYHAFKWVVKNNWWPPRTTENETFEYVRLRLGRHNLPVGKIPREKHRDFIENSPENIFKSVSADFSRFSLNSSEWKAIFYHLRKWIERKETLSAKISPNL